MNRSVLLAAFFMNILSATGQISPFNGREVPSIDADQGYRIILSGHIHGASNDRSGFPASTMLANLEMINGLGADVFLSTGDLFLDPTKEHKQYERSFFSRLEVPLFNAPGNHDASGYYGEQFGVTDQSFPLGRDQVVLLDTERNDGSLDKVQLALLEELVDKAPQRIFIITHRPIWADEDPRYGPLFEGNTRAMFGTNYAKSVFPVLERLAVRSQIFWVSGSMAGAGASIFFQKHAHNITFIQSAIRNMPRDAFLLADVGPDGIAWRTISLTDEPVLAPEAYDADLWWSQRGEKEAFNWRLLPYMVQMTVFSPAFWYGALMAGLLLVGVRRVLRRGL